MSRIEAFFRFLWDFVIGDDWRIAAGVAVAFGVTAVASNSSSSVWWIVPVVVAVLLTGSVWQIARQKQG